MPVKSAGSASNTVKKMLQELESLFLRKHLRSISFTLGTITFGEWCEILRFLLFQRHRLITGEYIKEFESEFARYIGAQYAFSFGAGRMALYAILRALEIKEGDEIILPAYTCVVVPNALIYAGVKPVYVDIKPDTLTIDVDKIEEKVTGRTKAILAQHMFDQFCDMAAIGQIAKKHHLKVIEDCAHALGAKYHGKKAGNFSDAAFFSLEQSKIITTWMGGVAITNNADLAEKLNEIESATDFPDKKAVGRVALNLVMCYTLAHPVTHFLGKYLLAVFRKLNVLASNVTEEEMAGKKPEKYPVRLSNLQARIGLRQLEKIEANLKHRQQVCQVYAQTMQQLGFTVAQCDGYEPAGIRFALLTRDRDKLKQIFQRHQIALGEWYNSVAHPKGSSLTAIHYEVGSCPIAEFAAEHCANLPTHPGVNKRDVERIIRLLRKYSDLLLDFGAGLTESPAKINCLSESATGRRNV